MSSTGITLRLFAAVLLASVAAAVQAQTSASPASSKARNAAQSTNEAAVNPALLFQHGQDALNRRQLDVAERRRAYHECLIEPLRDYWTTALRRFAPQMSDDETMAMKILWDVDLEADLSEQQLVWQSALQSFPSDQPFVTGPNVRCIHVICTYSRLSNFNVTLPGLALLQIPTERQIHSDKLDSSKRDATVLG